MSKADELPKRRRRKSLTKTAKRVARDISGSKEERAIVLLRSRRFLQTKRNWQEDVRVAAGRTGVPFRAFAVGYNLLLKRLQEQAMEIAEVLEPLSEDAYDNRHNKKRRAEQWKKAETETIAAQLIGLFTSSRR